MPRFLLFAVLLMGCKKSTAPVAVDLSATHGTLLEMPKPLIPEFGATAQDGTPRDVASLMGKPHVIWFFPAANTRGCTVEGCGYRDLHGEFAALGIDIVGVSFTEVALNKSWSEEMEFPYEIWKDDQQQLAIYYGAAEAGATYPGRRTRVLNGDGKVVLEYNDSIIVGAHPSEVLDDVTKLRAAGRL